MRVCLVGADCEENLGLCMIGAAVEAAGHQLPSWDGTRGVEKG